MEPLTLMVAAGVISTTLGIAAGMRERHSGRAAERRVEQMGRELGLQTIRGAAGVRLGGRWNDQPVRLRFDALSFGDGRPRFRVERTTSVAAPDFEIRASYLRAPDGSRARLEPHARWQQRGAPRLEGLRRAFMLMHRSLRVGGDAAAAAIAWNPDVDACLNPGAALRLEAGRLGLSGRRQPSRTDVIVALDAVTSAAELLEAPVAEGRQAAERHFMQADDAAELILRGALSQASLEGRQRLLAAARAHPRVEVRCCSAVLRRDRDALADLAEAAETPSPIARRAAHHAARLGDSAWRRTVARSTARHPLLREAILRSAGYDERTAPAWAEGLARIALDRLDAIEVRLAAVAALAECPTAHAEAPLLDIVRQPEAGTTRASAEAWRLRRLALEALRSVGTQPSLVVLRRMTEEAGLWAPHWQEALRARQAIEARLGPLQAGGLSLAVEPPGGLSLPHAVGGKGQ